MRVLYTSEARRHDLVESEIDRWERFGVAVVSGTYRQKDSWPSDWPRLPHVQTWMATRHSVRRGRRNLALRLGETVDGRHLAHLDFDGKCPCGSDRTDHQDSRGPCLSEQCRAKNDCACLAYSGVPPEVGLEAALAVLPADVCIIKTGRGYHVLFFSVRAIPESVLPGIGAEVAAHPGRLSIIPPSLHPSGDEYVWLRPPGEQLPVVDLDALGLTPEPKAAPRHRRTERARSTGGNMHGPADAKVVAFFAWLFAGLNVYEGQGYGTDPRGEFFLCPWHPDTKASLYVLWESALFFCQGCNRGGSARDLRALVALDSTGSPRKFPNADSGIPSGDRGTSGGVESLVERVAEIADQLPVRALNVTGRQLRECRQHVLTYDCDAGHAFAPRDEYGKPTPLSCDASSGICACCGPQRFLRDARAADALLPERVHVFRLIARTPGRELFDLGLSRRLTGRLKTYREAHALRAGSAARSLHLDPDGTAFHGHFIVAVPVEDATLVVSDGAFTVDDLGECSLDQWHRLQVAEQIAALERIETPEQLEAFYRSMHGQQQFRHFGDWYGKRSVDDETGVITTPKNAGGAGSARSKPVGQVICPLHPTARVRRSTEAAPLSSLVRGEGGELIPSGRQPVRTGGPR